MKWPISFFLAFIFSMYAQSAAAVTEVTVYADDGYPPYSYADGDKAMGIYNDILRKVFSRMDGYSVTIDPVPWKRGLMYVANGDGFAISPPYFRPKERPFISFYSVPILDEEIVAFCLEKTLKSPRKKWPEDYYGLNIGRNAGFLAGGQELADAANKGRIRLEETGNTRSNILKLLEGHIDVYVNDRIAILSEFKKIQRETDRYKNIRIVEGTVISREQGYLGFTAMDKGRFYFKDDFIKKFNAAIEEMKKNGEIKAISEKYINAEE